MSAALLSQECAQQEPHPWPLTAAALQCALTVGATPKWADPGLQLCAGHALLAGHLAAGSVRSRARTRRAAARLQRLLAAVLFAAALLLRPCPETAAGSLLLLSWARGASGWVSAQLLAHLVASTLATALARSATRFFLTS